MKIGLIQMNVIYDEVKTNLKNASKLIKKAVLDGAELCLLPECCDVGWASINSNKYADFIPGTTSDYFCNLAKKNKCYIVVGISEREEENIYNTAIIINEFGEIIGKHRKINILVGIENYSIGTSLNVFKTKFGMIGLNICADNLENSLALGSSLARMGAQIILSPSSWATSIDAKDYHGAEWRKPYSILSNNFNIPIIAVSNVSDKISGVWSDRKAIGNSIYSDIYGNTYSLKFNEEEVQVIDVKIGECLLLGTNLADKSHV